MKEIKMSESVHNPLNYIRTDEDYIKFLEYFFNIKLRCYQKLYLKMYVLLNLKKCKQLHRLLQFMRTK